MTDQKKQGPRRYKKRLRKGRAFFSLVMILFLMASCFAAGMRIYNRFFRPRAQVADSQQEALTTEGFSNRINVLLLGTDDGDSDDFDKDVPKRTDAMLLVSFDPENSQVSVLSLPRDTRVTIPGRRGHDKINAAYAYGGYLWLNGLWPICSRCPSTTICRWTGRASSRWWTCWGAWIWMWNRTWTTKIPMRT